jgi:hypothetical protein
MVEADFTALIYDIFAYYRSDKLPELKHIQSWIPFCKHIPSDKTTLNQIKDRLYQDKDNIPRNLPKAINEAYSQLPHDSNPVDYERDSDARFPVSYLNSGLQMLLKTKDPIAFSNWADQVHMPRDDQDRVRHKANITTGRIRFDRGAMRRNLELKSTAAALAIAANRKAPNSVNVLEAVQSVGHEPIWRQDKTLPIVNPEKLAGAFQVGRDVGPGIYPGLENAVKEALRRRNIQTAQMREPGEEG